MLLVLRRLYDLQPVHTFSHPEQFVELRGVHAAVATGLVQGGPLVGVHRRGVRRIRQLVKASPTPRWIRVLTAAGLQLPQDIMMQPCCRMVLHHHRILRC